MITAEDITAIIGECMALQSADAHVEYDTEILLDSVSFMWLHHVLASRFGYDLATPSDEVWPTLDSARSIHRYLARTSPDRVVAAD